jgi:prepilin-type N-terminal cleavage/methylation domain-containing protein
MNTMNNERGFTLVELMVGVTISSIITYSVFTVMRTSQEQIYATDVKMAIQETGREGLYKMTQELRLSAPNRVTIAGDGQSIEFQVPSHSAPVSSDYEANWDDAHTVSYQLDAANKQLIRIMDGDAANAVVLMNDVTDVDFEGDATEPSVVSVTVDLERALGDGRAITENIDVTLNAELRNPAVTESEGSGSSDSSGTDDDSADLSAESITEGGTFESGDDGSSDTGTGDTGTGDTGSGDTGSSDTGSGNNGNGNGSGSSNGNGKGKWKW